MNTRQLITRNITYSVVTVETAEGTDVNLVYGETTKMKEVKKLLKSFEGEDLPKVTVDVYKEQRAITLEKFLQNSVIIKDEPKEETTNA